MELPFAVAVFERLECFLATEKRPLFIGHSARFAEARRPARLAAVAGGLVQLGENQLACDSGAGGIAMEPLDCEREAIALEVFETQGVFLVVGKVKFSSADIALPPVCEGIGGASAVLPLRDLFPPVCGN